MKLPVPTIPAISASMLVKHLSLSSTYERFVTYPWVTQLRWSGHGLLGYEYAQMTTSLSGSWQLCHAHVHWYGKTESRPGRKLGHVTVRLDAQNRSEASAIAQTIESIWYGDQDNY